LHSERSIGKEDPVAEPSAEVATLKAWRRRRLLTVRALAAAAGVAQRTVVEVEAGRRGPQPGTIRALSAALGVEPEQVTEFRRAMGLGDQKGGHQ
jgi:transcriptional regulator with XRE-family HTH domain